MRLLATLLIVTLGCSVEHTGLVGAGDAVTPDADLPETGRPDVSTPDATLPDEGVPDGGLDLGTPDGSPPDAGVPDMSPPDMSPPDMSPPDMSVDVDPCSVGPDTDGDGIRDACDECRGFDDALDVDSDGIPDGCDDWPCGTRPTIPVRVTREQITVSGVNLEGAGNTVVVNRGDRFAITFDWAIEQDPACRGCTNQIEWGFSRIGRLGCVYDDEPPGGGDSGAAAVSNIPVPTAASGAYDLRINRGYRTRCPAPEDFVGWWPTAPPAANTIGVVCVTP